MRLNDKHAAITGGGSGIGLAIATRFVTEGANVTIIEHNAEAGEAAAEALGEGAQLAICDVADRAAVR